MPQLRVSLRDLEGIPSGSSELEKPDLEIGGKSFPLLRASKLVMDHIPTKLIWRAFRARLFCPCFRNIGTVLAGHHGFAADELDFILNHDIKYRLGRSAEEEE